MNHTQLRDDLARSQAATERVVLTEFTLGKVIGASAPPGRGDVITLRRAYSKMDITLFEVKADRSDFLKDIREGKYQRYLPYCDRLYFATLPGVCRKDELPPQAGWIVRGENGWSVVTAAKRLQRAELPADVMQAMIFCAHLTAERLDRAHLVDEIRLVGENRELLYQQGRWRLKQWVQEKVSAGEQASAAYAHLRAELCRALHLENADGYSDSELARLVRRHVDGTATSRNAEAIASLLTMAAVFLRHGRTPAYNGEAIRALLLLVPDLRELLPKQEATNAPEADQGLQARKVGEGDGQDRQGLPA